MGTGYPKWKSDQRLDGSRLCRPPGGTKTQPSGQGGNVVLSGHHNIKGKAFRYLVDLEPGDTVALYVGDQLYQYNVPDKFIIKDKDESEVVWRANARWIASFDEERLTLVTCWPYNNNTHRLIVIARPINTT